MIDRIRTLDEATPRERQRIFALLDRCGLSVVDPPSGDMGVVYATFLPWRPHGKRWAYIGRCDDWCLRYHGSGKLISHAKRVHRRGEFIKVCIGFAERGAPLVALEEDLQIKAGVRRTREDAMHRDWLNVVAHGGGGAVSTKEQQIAASRIGARVLAERERTDPAFRAKMQAVRSATGKISGKINGKIHGKINGPAAAVNMGRLQAGLRWSNDPTFWDHIPLPPVVHPQGWNKQLNKSRYGFDLPEQSMIVPVARPAVNGPRVTFSSSKMARVLMTIYGRMDRPPTFAEHCADLRAEFPAPDGYGSLTGARLGITRDCRKGLFSLVSEGRVILGPGGPESDCHDPRLTWTPAQGWRRGRVVSRGPYGWAR